MGTTSCLNGDLHRAVRTIFGVGFFFGWMSEFIDCPDQKKNRACDNEKINQERNEVAIVHVIAPAFAASAGVLNAIEPSLAARRITNLFEKSSPPVSRLIGGMTMSFTSELIIPPNAAPIITPTARSTALPFTANSLNSFQIFLIQRC